MKFDGKEEALEREARRNGSPAAKPAGKARRKSNIEAAKAEALAQGVEFDYDGKHYSIDPAEEWDLDVFEAAAKGDLITAIQLLVGEDQYLEFKTDAEGDRKKRTLKDLNEFWEHAQAAQGVEPGE